MSPLKSSLVKSAGKLFGVFKEKDLSLRGDIQSIRLEQRNDWVRVLNQAGPGNGTLSLSGYSEMLVFGVSGGGGGGSKGNDDGGGGGGGGAGQFNGYPIIIGTGPYTYSVPAGGNGASGPPGSDGSNSPNLTISNPGGTVFLLPGGSGAVSTPDNPTGNSAGVGASQNSYTSHAGGTGNVALGESVDNRPGNGTPGEYGGAGGGGGGSWNTVPSSNPLRVPQTQGQSGYNNTLNVTVSLKDFSTFDTNFVATGSNGGPGGTGYPADGTISAVPGTNNPPAGAGTGGSYCGGGGAGGGVQFFGTGNSGYGAGGGGKAGQDPGPGGGGGNGGAGYLVVYARTSST